MTGWTVSEGRGRARRLLVAAGVPERDAARTADAIVLADCWGIGSHGLMRLPYYLERLTAGGQRADAGLVARNDNGAVVSWDGQAGLGHWQLWAAALEGAARAGRHGVSVVSVANSSHCGALGVYTLPALRRGYACLAFSNGPAVMPAWGGAAPVLSTSPIAAGVPFGDRPAIIDLATSAVARGRIAALAAKGEAVPAGWALDAEGNPTTDPAAALAGMLAPLGGAKGFALALLVESLTGGLVGPQLSTGVSDMFRADDATVPQGISHLVVTIDPGAIDPDRLSEERLGELEKRVQTSGGRLPGAGRRMPHEIEDDEALAIDATTLGRLGEWLDRLGVADVDGVVNDDGDADPDGVWRTPPAPPTT
ncbi:Ldh family oxidoreductase [Intrasporangium mesophilum]